MTEEPRIMLLAVDLTTASARARDALTLGRAAVAETLRRVRAAHPDVELVVLADSERFELYTTLASHRLAFRAVLRGILGRVERIDELSSVPTLEARGTAVLRHLLRSAVGFAPTGTILERVAAMKQALELAAAAGTIGAQTSALFERAIHAGWRAQAETAFGRSATAPERELEELGAERIVEEELVAWQAECFGTGVGVSGYPSVEPKSALRLRAASPRAHAGNKAVA